MEHPNCKGCATHKETAALGTTCFYAYNENSDCPCSKCLVKMMCDDPCDNYYDWIGLKTNIKTKPGEK